MAKRKYEQFNRGAVLSNEEMIVDILASTQSLADSMAHGIYLRKPPEKIVIDGEEIEVTDGTFLLMLLGKDFNFKEKIDEYYKILKIIDKNERKAIHKIIKIRNEIAHSASLLMYGRDLWSDHENVKLLYEEFNIIWEEYFNLFSTIGHDNICHIR